MAIAIFSGAKEYQVWRQILDLWSMGARPLELLGDHSPHALRYALLYPLLAFSREVELDENSVLSVIMLIFCFVTSRNIICSVEAISLRSRGRVMAAVVIAAATELMFFFMNGRIGFAFLGYSIILREIIMVSYVRQSSASSFFNIFLAIVLCSVSSGALVSASFALAVLLASEVSRALTSDRFSRLTLAVIAIAAICSALFGKFVLVGIEKNATYFGGGYEGFLGLLNHGFGRVIGQVLNFGDPLVLAAGFALMAVMSFWAVSLAHHKMLLTILLVAFACGLFGYSTLSLIYIPLMVFVGVGLRKARFST